MISPAWLCAAALVLAPAAPAADLAKIERKLAKEPAYQSKSPKYCLLVFGPDARTCVWLVQDGDVLYVDRNGSGDLTEIGKRVKVKQQGDSYRSFEMANYWLPGVRIGRCVCGTFRPCRQQRRQAVAASGGAFHKTRRPNRRDEPGGPPSIGLAGMGTGAVVREIAALTPPPKAGRQWRRPPRPQVCHRSRTPPGG